MALTLNPEIEKALTEEAARQGTTPDALVEKALRMRFGIPFGHVGPRGEELRAQVNAAAGCTFANSQRLLCQPPIFE